MKWVSDTPANAAIGLESMKKHYEVEQISTIVLFNSTASESAEAT